MRALVTGANGFIGSHVVERFRSGGWEPIRFDILDSFEDQPPVDVVVSLAATADPATAIADPAFAYTNGTRIMVETLEYARKVGASVLHVSTNEVYGSKDGPVYAPRGPYAGAKACQEIVCVTYPDVPVTVAVTQSVFGERQQPNKLVPSIVRALLNNEPVMLQRDGTVWASRPFLYAGDLADALIELAGHYHGPRVHVGSRDSLSVLEVAHILGEALDRTPNVQPVQANGRPGHELQVEAIGCDLPWWMPQRAERPLRRTALWYREHSEACAIRS
jgi:nucleoside-diphosphate-sugar epimerase